MPFADVEVVINVSDNVEEIRVYRVQHRNFSGDESDIRWTVKAYLDQVLGYETYHIKDIKSGN